MQHTMAKIFGKPNDYKICENCGTLNWYENEDCRCCGSSNHFLEVGEAVSSWCNEEYDYWKLEEGYSEEEIDNILIEV